MSQPSRVANEQGQRTSYSSRSAAGSCANFMRRFPVAAKTSPSPYPGCTSARGRCLAVSGRTLSVLALCISFQLATGVVLAVPGLKLKPVCRRTIYQLNPLLLKDCVRRNARVLDCLRLAWRFGCTRCHLRASILELRLSSDSKTLWHMNHEHAGQAEAAHLVDTDATDLRTELIQLLLLARLQTAQLTPVLAGARQLRHSCHSNVLLRAARRFNAELDWKAGCGSIPVARAALHGLHLPAARCSPNRNRSRYSVSQLQAC